MKILIAIDSFKGSISSSIAADKLAEGLMFVDPSIELIKIPMADGGEGTVESVIESIGGNYSYAEVNDPLFRKIKAKYGIFDNGKSAIIEMAEASGIELLKQKERNPLNSSTYGTGELILNAISKGVENVIVGIGGSATNDGGIGMATALGIKFYDEDKNLLSGTGSSLNKIVSIDIKNRIHELNGVKITVICDVVNPLFGLNGAAYIYGPQKGADSEKIKVLDSGLKNLSRVVERGLGLSLHNSSGAGAAGGLGYGLLVFTDARLVSGIEFLIDFLKLEEKIKTADFVITGEGKMDHQTLNNKTPWGVMKISKKYNKKVIAVAGKLEENSIPVLKNHFDFLYSLSDIAKSDEDSINNAGYYLKQVAARIINDIKLNK